MSRLQTNLILPQILRLFILWTECHGFLSTQNFYYKYESRYTILSVKQMHVHNNNEMKYNAEHNTSKMALRNDFIHYDGLLLKHTKEYNT